MSSTNYDLKKIKAIAFDVDGVLSPSVIPMNTDGEPLRMVNIKDGYAIQLAVKLGLKLAIFTGGKTHAVKVRFEGLGMTDIYLGAAMKLPLFEKWMKQNTLTPEETIYVGDDIPDIPCMRHAGLAVAPADAAPEAKQEAGYISRYNGGYGVGRDIIEQVLKAQNLWLNDLHAFGW